MDEALLQTKLYSPPIRKSLVPRPHLIDQLNSGLNGSLTLISAPAGFGKSTLVVDWLSQVNRPFGWVSLDEDDNDLTRFFTYVAGALQSIEGVGNSTWRLVQDQQATGAKNLVTAFVSDCIATSDAFILVLDDFHNISATLIHQAVAFLLKNMPRNLHLVLTSRVDPLLPFSRLRASGQMQELRLGDLRFTPNESTKFLKNVMGLNLTNEQASALEARTEGWIAGLQLAGLSLQGLKNDAKIADFIADFTGSHRYIFDYLTDEVLSQQPENVKSFLIQTSVLEQFNAALCDTVTGQKNSQSILHALENGNMFLLSLDENREWYRYHHLFADLLYQRLLNRFPEKVPGLFQRASRWYADRGDVEQAVSYALAGGHLNEAARLLDAEAFKIIGRSKLRSLNQMLQKLPEAVRSEFPRLGLAQGWLYMFFAEYELAERSLKQVEVNFQSSSVSEVDFPEALARAYIAMIRAYSATRQEILSDAINYSKEAMTRLESVPEEQAQVLRCTVLLNLGQIQAALDQVEPARKTYEQAIIDGQESHRVSAVMASHTCLMQLERARGRLSAARSVGHRGLAWLNAHSSGKSQIYASEGEIRIQMALIRYDQNRLDQAKMHLLRGLELYRSTSSQRYVECLHYIFLVRLAESEIDEAVKIHREINLAFREFPSALYQRNLVNCIERLLYLNRIQPEEKEWRQELVLWSPSFEVQRRETINTRLEPQFLTKAKVLKHANNLEDSLSLLNDLANAAESASRFGDLIQYRVQQSLVLARLSQRESALTLLGQAVSMAEPENFMRTFLDEGENLMILVSLLPESSYRDEILSYFHPTNPSRSALPTKFPSGYSNIEPLSERELDVLAYLTSHLSGPEIADQLNISINTYKTHIKNIYSKLGVSSRNDAVIHAQALGYL